MDQKAYELAAKLRKKDLLPVKVVRKIARHAAMKQKTFPEAFEKIVGRPPTPKEKQTIPKTEAYKTEYELKKLYYASSKGMTFPWVVKKHKQLIQYGMTIDEESGRMIDPKTAQASLKEVAKLLGFYEQHNEQKRDTKIEIVLPQVSFTPPQDLIDISALESDE